MEFLQVGTDPSQDGARALRGSTEGATHHLLGEALSHAAERLVGVPTRIELITPADPRWVKRSGQWQWVSRVDVRVEVSGEGAASTISWPQRCDPTAASPAPFVSPGAHRGFYLGRALAVSTGLRLDRGLHAIARPMPDGDVRLHGLLGFDVGPDYAVGTASDGGRTGRDASDRLVAFARSLLSNSFAGRHLTSQTLAAVAATLGLPATTEPDGTRLDVADAADVADAVGSWLRTELDHARSGARRILRADRAVSRTLGPHDLVAEAFLEGVVAQLRLVFPSRHIVSEEGAESSTDPGRAPDALVVAPWHRSSSMPLPELLARLLAQSCDAAVRDIGAGRRGLSAVVADVGSGTTIARVEEDARATFIGYRGLARTLRGRPDLRDLDPAWRGVLCPVQTPESTETGLVRFRTVESADGAQDPPGDEWLDLSASAALIPFIDHDEPARASVASKNLKQAIPVWGAEPPVVATGWERVLADRAGVARAPLAGRVSEVGPDRIVVEGPAGRRAVGYGAPWSARGGPDTGWVTDVAEGDTVGRDTVLAHAPDVILDGSGEPELAFGVNALVALTPWHGLNYEDGIVVSQSLAERLGSTHLMRLDERLEVGESVECPADYLVGVGMPFRAGTPLVTIGRGDRVRILTAPLDGEFLGSRIDRERGRVSALIRVERALAVGDKLSNRHQGKGVVSRILRTEEMPRLPDGRPVEAILNPLGVLRRLNVGQLWEMHVGLPAILEGAGSVRAGRTVEHPAAVLERCAAVGAPRGRMRLRLPDGTPVGDPDKGVVVGPQYIMKLDHLAVAKVSIRGRESARSPRSLQPARSSHWRRGDRVGAAQRLGEMELWGLQAAGALPVVGDAQRERGAWPEQEDELVRPTARAVAAHLRVAGLDLVALPGEQPLAEAHLRDVTAVGVRDAEEGLLEFPALARLAALPAHHGQGQTALERLVSHPLHTPKLHGEVGSPERARVRFAIGLPFPIAHPWPGDAERPPLTAIPILPPAFRVLGVDGLDDRYGQLAHALSELSGAPTVEERAHVVRLVHRILGAPAEPGPDPVTILGRVSGKRGLLRRALLGQAVTHSGRGVIVPDPERDPETVGLPRRMFAELGCDMSAHGDVVVVNRQPTLHPYNLVALRAEPVVGDAIHLPPLVIGALAGDFDGDTVAVHRPVREAARASAWTCLRPAANLRSAAGGRLLAKSDLDISLGLHLLSMTAVGRARLGDGHDIQTTLDRDGIERVFSECALAKEEPRRAVLALAELERVGWEASTGWSVGALDLLADHRLGRLAEASAAGAAGKAVGQLLEHRGTVAGGNPWRMPPDVSGNFLTGLDPADYFATAPGSMATLAEKKLLSPHAGALTKMLVEIADHVVIEGDHCGVRGHPSPLNCLGVTTVCRACYGPDRATGAPVADGRRVGLLAAMAIGERSTQLSMKVFHGGGVGAGALGGEIQRLRSVFGDGAERLFGDVAAAAEILGDSVDRVHVEVILRQVLAAAEEPHTAGFDTRARRAERHGRTAFERATARGSVRSLVDDRPAWTSPAPTVSPRTALSVGVG